jgi:hypothetical protein
MSADDHPTPLSQQAAEPVDDPPSWHGPVEALTGRVTKLEVAQAATTQKLAVIERKTDAQTVTLDSHTTKLDSINGHLTTLVSTAANVATNPTVRKYAMSILASTAIILGFIAAALAGRASSTPPAPAPAPAITVVVPKEAHS